MKRQKACYRTKILLKLTHQWISAEIGSNTRAIEKGLFRLGWEYYKSFKLSVTLRSYIVSSIMLSVSFNKVFRDCSPFLKQNDCLMNNVDDYLNIYKKNVRQIT